LILKQGIGLEPFLRNFQSIEPIFIPIDPAFPFAQSEEIRKVARQAYQTVGFRVMGGIGLDL